METTSPPPAAMLLSPAPCPSERRAVPCDEDETALAWDEHDTFLRELWASRGLARELIRRDLRVRYKQAVMGCAWAVLMPALVIVAGMLVRVAIAFAGGHTVDIGDLAGIAVKAVPWSFFVGAMGFATTSLTANANLITKTYFPRELLPLSAVATQAADSSIGAAVLLIVLTVSGIRMTAAIFWVPLLAGCLLCFTAGAALLTSCANLFFRDVKYLVHVLLTFGIFFTPVFFEPGMFGPAGARMMMLNPLAPLLEGLRLSVVAHHNLLYPLVAAQHGHVIVAWSPWDLAYSACCAVALLVAGLVWFHRAEARFAENV
jgi:ABC-type polysaccharide/polyol phosphate export permease